MNRKILIAATVIFLGTTATTLILMLRPTRYLIIQIESSFVSDFRSTIEATPPEFNNFEILQSPGRDLWMLSTSDSSEKEVDSRMVKLSDFLHRWGEAEYKKHGAGFTNSAIIKHERSEGSLKRLFTRFSPSVPFFR